MPIYEYQCQACKKRYELQQSFSAESTHTCEKCGKGVAKRILHAPTVVFKGSGFYATDNKPGRTPIESSSDSDSGSSDSSSSSESTTAKSSKKSESKSTESKSKDKSADSASEAAV
ncbi:MAG: zinc ribbon domain-containing protein [Dehalococcoidia bacterium]